MYSMCPGPSNPWPTTIRVILKQNRYIHAAVITSRTFHGRFLMFAMRRRSATKPPAVARKAISAVSHVEARAPRRRHRERLSVRPRVVSTYRAQSDAARHGHFPRVVGGHAEPRPSAWSHSRGGPLRFRTFASNTLSPRLRYPERSTVEADFHVLELASWLQTSEPFTHTLAPPRALTRSRAPSPPSRATNTLLNDTRGFLFAAVELVTDQTSSGKVIHEAALPFQMKGAFGDRRHVNSKAATAIAARAAAASGERLAAGSRGAVCALRDFAKANTLSETSLPVPGLWLKSIAGEVECQRGGRGTQEWSGRRGWNSRCAGRIPHCSPTTRLRRCRQLPVGAIAGHLPRAPSCREGLRPLSIEACGVGRPAAATPESDSDNGAFAASLGGGPDLFESYIAGPGGPYSLCPFPNASGTRSATWVTNM